MRLDVADAVSVGVGVGQRFDHGVGLAVDARRGVAGLFRAVVVDGGAFDDGADIVAVGEGIAEPFQNDHAAAAAEDRAVRPGVESADVSVGRGDSDAVGEISGAVRDAD